jgi:hypothetical protein
MTGDLDRRLLVVRVARLPVRELRLARLVVRSGISLPREEWSVPGTHLHCMNDEQTLLDLNRNDLEHHTVWIRAKEHNAVVLERRIRRRRLF